MKLIQAITTSLCVALAFSATVIAQDAKPKPSVLITSANIFDGQNEKLATGMSVLVEGNKITKIAKSIDAPSGATVIDANGRTMTPGLIDCHVHLMWNLSPGGMFDGMPDYLAEDVGGLQSDVVAGLHQRSRHFRPSPWGEAGD